MSTEGLANLKRIIKANERIRGYNVLKLYIDAYKQFKEKENVF